MWIVYRNLSACIVICCNNQYFVLGMCDNSLFKFIMWISHKKVRTNMFNVQNR